MRAGRAVGDRRTMRKRSSRPPAGGLPRGRSALVPPASSWPSRRPA